jgi:hypothetical protein
MTWQIPVTRRRQVRAGVAIAVILTAGATSAACSASTSTPSAAPATPAPPAHRHAHPLRGTISAENGNSWTVTNTRGVSYTVNITPTTTFGTKKAPATPQGLPIGNHIVVTGTRTGTTIEATRIAPAPAIPANPTDPAPTGTS